uniref:Uncharacterized protein n=1 Tax=Coccolithus braarudii TaxID=221442 RepID=A0A7S0PZ97_9EUKA
MMAPDGLKRAHIAMQLLSLKAEEGGLGAEIAATGGARLLLQTMLLHPESSLRLGACELISACMLEADERFIAQAMEQRLPLALLRVVREEGRRVQKQMGFDEHAVDPDLPLRRLSVPMLGQLLSCDERAAQLLAEPNAVSVFLEACSSPDAIVQRGACALALTILRRADAHSASLLASVEADPASLAACVIKAVSPPVPSDETDGAAKTDGAAETQAPLELMLALSRECVPFKSELLASDAVDLITRAREELDASDAGSRRFLLDKTLVCLSSS